jgi:transcriptional regulator with GAF, ATPase, and Fis domain
LEIAAPQWQNSGAGIAPAKNGNLDKQEKMVDEQDRVVQILRSLVERAAMPTPDNTQAVSAPELTNNGASATPATAGNMDEEQIIVRILRETKGRAGGANGAAARLGLKRTTLIGQMKKLGIEAREVLDWQRSKRAHAASP